MNKVISALILSVIILAVSGFANSVNAQTPSSCPSTCPNGSKLWIDTACQQKRLLSGPEAAGGCCLFYCAVAPDPNRTLADSNTGIDLDPFETSIKLDTPQGIATLIATGFQLFLGVIALYLIYIAVKSALLLGQSDNSGAQEQAKKNITSAVVGLIIVGSALGILQIVINLLGLGSINDIFRAIDPFLSSGTP